MKDLGPKGFAAIVGAMNDTPNIPEFVSKYGPNVPVGPVDRMAAGAYMQIPPMERSYVPFMLFIDRDGVVQAQYTGGDAFLSDESAQEKNIRDLVTKLLAKPAKAPAKKAAGKKK